MKSNSFKKLAIHLDKLPGGYPSTKSGVELRILERLFTEEEARLAIHLTLIEEESNVIAFRAKDDVDKIGAKLMEMSLKGLIFRVERPGQPVKYMAAQFVVGIWEYHVNDLNEELIRDVNEYLPTLMNPKEWSKSPQLRTIPVEKSINPNHETMPYEEARELIKSRKRFVVAPCICRREHELVGEGCNKLSEACLVFDGASRYYLKNGLGREIDMEEALRILARADEEGLVVQPSNSQNAINMCLCCGCCCQVLKGLKRHPDPAQYVSSAYIVKADMERCNGCGKCVKRCQMNAFELKDKKVVVDLGRCIGCGLCVTTCKKEALELERKSKSPKVPERYATTLINLGKARGKLSNAKLAAMALKSKADRLLASKLK
jgi:electron transport complex protein RnfB